MKIIATTDGIHFYYIQVSTASVKLGMKRKQAVGRQMIESETVTQKID